MNSSTYQNDESVKFGVPTVSTCIVGGPQGRSNHVVPKKSRLAGGEFQKPFHGKLEYITPSNRFEGLTKNKGNHGDRQARDMDPLTLWLLQGKADDPWHILDIVSISGTYQLIKSEMGKMEDSWSMKVEGGSVQNGKISKL
jgi:hypothetical protein